MKTGLLLVNLGSPDSPATPDVRRYLKEFLLDWRVIDIPSVQRNLLVRGVIAPFRAPKSGASYKKIWTDKGSPLVNTTRDLARMVLEKLGRDYQVEYAMRYQNPSIRSVLQHFRKEPPDKLIIFPLYPHYASSTVGSVHEEVMKELATWQVIPQLQFVNSYYNDPGLIAAFAARGREHDLQKYDHVLFSFHGLPERQLIKADTHNHCLRKDNCCDGISVANQYCYSAQCHATAFEIARSLGIPREKYTICFQSRLGKTPWKRPFTTDVIDELAKAGKKRILAFSPAFVSDCLETIYEVAVEYKEEFVQKGGEELTLVTGLNTHPQWVETVVRLVKGT